MAKTIRTWLDAYLQAAPALLWALAALGLAWTKEDKDSRPGIPIGLLGLMVLTNFLQVFAARRLTHLPDDLWFFLYPLAAAALWRLLGKAWEARTTLVLGCAAGLSLVWSCLSWLKLPWVHPVLHGLAPVVTK